MLNGWFVLEQKGTILGKFFIDNKYNKVAIYGMVNWKIDFMTN